MASHHYIKEILSSFRRDRWLAHATVFRHRRTQEPAPAHRELVAAIHGPTARLSIEGFRGIGKSTHLEEAAIIRAIFEEFRFMVVVGESYDMACARLASIKREFEINEFILNLVGPQKREVWRENHIVLNSGISMMALGRDQSMTGIKYLDHRPDAALVDDVESPEEVRTDEDRQKTWLWFLRTFLPALDDPLGSWVRVLGTRRGANSLQQRLDEAKWPTIRFPIEYRDEAGERRATWPAKFPLPYIDQMRVLYRGDMDTFSQEYMCEPMSQSDRPFKNLRVSLQVRTWQPVWAMYDPARTTGPRSAMTGKAVWSWIKNRLVVWDAAGELWLPDQLVTDIYDTNEEYGPVKIGVEEDGLNEWIRQPLRREGQRRGVLAPIAPLKAPRGKLQFIRGLQPYFEAGEVEFAKPLPELEAQLASFPSGRIDVPNALAYALQLKPGQPVYDNFGPEHIQPHLPHERLVPTWLACNAERGLVTAVLFQQARGRLRILADWALEDDADQAVPLIAREAGMLTRATPLACCPVAHWERYQNVGLVQALRRVPLTVERGAAVLRGREVLTTEFGQLLRGEPAVQVAEIARHTVLALSGGYARMLDRAGMLAPEAETGLYRVLMEGLEACLGRAAAAEGDERAGNWHQTSDGRRYLKYGHAAERRM